MNLTEEIEELANTVTHGLGLVLSTIAYFNLFVFSLNNNIWQFLAFNIYGLTLIGVYTASTFYHGAVNCKVKDTLRQLDYISIYLFIAGTYTAFIPQFDFMTGFALFLIIWLSAFSGIYAKVMFPESFFINSLTYLVMGWTILLFCYPVFLTLSTGVLLLLLFGGLAYTFGFYFFAMERPFYHAIWHLFVLMGSMFHYIAVLSIT